MAAGDATPFPVRAKAYRVYFTILDADGDPVASATGLDSEVSIDGAAIADCTNEATYITGSAGGYYLELTAAEMTGSGIYIEVKTTSVGAKTTVLTLYPMNIPEPAAVPAWSGLGIESVLGWVLALVRNRVTSTNGVMTLRNDANSASIATAAVSDDGTTFVRDEWA